jgi:hypothetical protein
MDEKLLREVMTEAWGRFSAYVDSELTRHITEPKWDWPRGESPRDIVDRGDLRASQQMEIQEIAPGSPLSVLITKFRYMAPQAAAVHDGAVFKAVDSEGNPRTMMARPWTRELQKERQKLQTAFKLHFALAAKRRGLGRGGGAAPPALPPAGLPPAGGAA